MSIETAQTILCYALVFLALAVTGEVILADRRARLTLDRARRNHG